MFKRVKRIAKSMMPNISGIKKQLRRFSFPKIHLSYLSLTILSTSAACLGLGVIFNYFVIQTMNQMTEAIRSLAFNHPIETASHIANLLVIVENDKLTMLWIVGAVSWGIIIGFGLLGMFYSYNFMKPVKSFEKAINALSEGNESHAYININIHSDFKEFFSIYNSIVSHTEVTKENREKKLALIAAMSKELETSPTLNEQDLLILDEIKQATEPKKKAA